jgi:hypothetical protein
MEAEMVGKSLIPEINLPGMFCDEIEVDGNRYYCKTCNKFVDSVKAKPSGEMAQRGLLDWDKPGRPTGEWIFTIECHGAEWVVSTRDGLLGYAFVFGDPFGAIDAPSR